MELKVAPDYLLSALRIANLCVGNKGGISAHFLFRVRDGSAEILSKSTRTFSVCPVTCTTEVEEDEDPRFTVEAWRLIKWVNTINSGNNAITLSHKDGEVTAKCGRSKVKFRSLDPNGFRGWDSLYQQAEDCCEVDPPVFSRAIAAGRIMVSQEDTLKPENCQLVAWGESLAATDQKGVVNVSLPYEGLNLRVPFKDISTIQKFIEDKDTVENPVYIKEAKRAKEDGGSEFDFFVRPDGTYIGVARLALLPAKVLTPGKDQKCHAYINLHSEEFQTGLAVLTASAPKGHHTAHFSISGESVTLSMPSAAGGKDSYPMIHTQAEEGGEDLEFFIDYHYFIDLFGLFNVSELRVGVYKAGDKGYVSVYHDDSDDDANSYSFAIGCLFET